MKRGHKTGKEDVTVSVPIAVDVVANPSAALGSSSLPSSRPRHRIFISHASRDNAFGAELVQRLRTALEPEGYDLWYDSRGRPGPDGLWQDGIAPAQKWQDEIQRAIAASDIFLVILSPAAMASPWVADEIGLAWSSKNVTPTIEAGLVVVPVLLAPCSIPPWLTLIQWVDFTTWRAADAPSVGDTVASTDASAANPSAERPASSADSERAWATLLSAVLDTRTRARPERLVGPPFDLSVLPPLEHFIGRERSVEQVLTLLTQAAAGQQANVAAANGLGGIGKTALATEVARRLMSTRDFPDGIAVVDCRDQRGPDAARALLRRVLSRFTAGRKEPDADDLGTLGDAARQILASKRALVILDNVEADLPAAQLITPLRAVGVAVLSTSREPLPAIPTAATLRLDLLPEDEALALFEHYYGNIFSPDERRAARAVITALGRHTLATKLAAANAATLGRSLAAIARELETHPDRALLLANSDEAVLWVLSSSAATLSPQARRLFAALAAFGTDDIGRKAALAVAEALTDNNPNTSLDRLLSLRLADTAYLDTVPSNDAEDETDTVDRERIRLHPLVRAYARSLFDGRRSVSGDLEWTADPREHVEVSIAAWYASYVNQVPSLALQSDETNILGTLERLAQIQARGDDGTLGMLAWICVKVSALWLLTGRTSAALHWLPLGIRAAIHLEQSARERGDSDVIRFVRVHALLELAHGRAMQHTGRLSEAEQIYGRNLSQWREIDDQGGEASALNNLGEVERNRGRLDEATAYFNESLLIFRRLGERLGEASVINNLGLGPV